MVILYLFAGFVVLSTGFMLFLQWLAKDSKDAFAKKLRTIGWTGVALGWGVIALGLCGYLSFLY